MRNTPSRRSAVGQFLFVGRLGFLSVPHRRLKLVLICFFLASELVGSSDHSDCLFSYCHLLVRKGILHRRRMDVLLGRRVLSISLVCQGNFGPRRCRREPTLQSAFIATSLSASAWCVPADARHPTAK
ncbi:hypothetical protein DPX16_4891 [Anabarilius grahami]|uniref:Uncharacterized protein n=1 Tax=Anabarilius grahami TaxID=495550 RepID=A0A3N0XUG5_ANAGA|nr:hypothetical protein DPX16_4891 [Anabarilius grahami]